MKGGYSFRPVIPRDIPILDRWLRTPEVAPFAYAQHSDVHAWPQPHFELLPPKSRAIDAFIGEPAMIGCGHGAAFLRLLALRLRQEGAPMVAIDPALDNSRARRAYRRAGFKTAAIVATQDGPAALMIFTDETQA
jgi:aminoglycoside 6'-N-acetyltransferase